MRGLESKNDLSYKYAKDGKTQTNKIIPNIPIMWLRLRTPQRSAVTPAIVDSGFDGGLYSDDKLPTILEEETPIGIETLYSPGSEVKCEIFKVRAWLIEEKGGKDKIDIGQILIYVPIRVRDLAENIILGREVLNKLDVALEHGEETRIYK